MECTLTLNELSSCWKSNISTPLLYIKNMHYIINIIEEFVCHIIICSLVVLTKLFCFLFLLFNTTINFIVNEKQQITDVHYISGSPPVVHGPKVVRTP